MRRPHIVELIADVPCRKVVILRAPRSLSHQLVEEPEPASVRESHLDYHGFVPLKLRFRAFAVPRVEVGDRPSDAVLAHPAT